MAKTLVIVESPAKAKTIGRYLGKDYDVAASVGHVRDLPKSTLGVDIDKDFQPRYITMPGKESVIRDLKKKKDKADLVLLATDPDREGEAIAWHLATALKLDPQSNLRISFNEISKKAVTEALNHARPIDMDLVNAQQTRRILDRLVGYELSPLLWKKVLKGLSAGRVQSLATRMIVDREREITAFVPEEYWWLDAQVKTGQDEQFRARFHGLLKEEKVSVVKLRREADVQSIMKDVQDTAFKVHTVKKRTSRRASYPPFTTSSLQQEASRALGFSASRTMRVAQMLYEGVEISGQGQTSLVTYIRTDSLRINTDAIQEIRQVIEKTYGKEYLPDKPRHFKNKKSAQDAHEAIRPIHFDLSPDQIAGDLTSEQYRLYRLIWNKFMSSQMASAVFDTVTCDIVAGEDKLFRVKGETLIFPGWMKVYGSGESKTADDSDELDKESLPPLEEGQALQLLKLLPEQKFTKPPARYTEASLIKALEEEGVGRPSTYAPTIFTILNRNYAEKEDRYLKPTHLGEAVTALLEENFANIVDTQFTAKMEEKLDLVESGEASSVELLKEFYPPFHAQVEKADEAITEKVLKDKETGRTCPKCGQGQLVIKHGRFGEFIACNRYPDCDYTENIEVKAPGKCPLCGSGLLEKKSRKRSATFYVCDKKGSNPDCSFISWDLPLEQKCELCGSYMVEKRYRGRKYKLCSNKDCPNGQYKSKKSKARVAKKDQESGPPSSKAGK
ncbi:MAG: type I DNA topoisomerase [Eubacteriales bacterium]|nr:type I DNA topoisomerase [Clostridiales bacterium]MDY5836427.1 type I DNA topoisomerase [Eubacteriales bacterium]